MNRHDLESIIHPQPSKYKSHLIRGLNSEKAKRTLSPAGETIQFNSILFFTGSTRTNAGIRKGCFAEIFFYAIYGLHYLLLRGRQMSYQGTSEYFRNIF